MRALRTHVACFWLCCAEHQMAASLRRTPRSLGKLHMQYQDSNNGDRLHTAISNSLET